MRKLLNFGAILVFLTLLAASCALRQPSPAPANIKLIPFEATTQEFFFESQNNVQLAGQLDWPPGQDRPPLIFIMHHSGPVDRDSYQYLAARLVPAGYAVFRFDKRG